MIEREPFAPRDRNQPTMLTLLSGGSVARPEKFCLSPRDLLARRVNLVVLVYFLPLCSIFVRRPLQFAFICCQVKREIASVDR